MNKEHQPKILIPYIPAIDGDSEKMDFFITLRPEANGVQVESLLFKVVSENPLYKNNVSFAYLANIPGDFIINQKIMEQHYHLKISFARKGRTIFTPYMKARFYEHFRVSADDVSLMGAFQALASLGCSEEELFQFRVDNSEMLDVNGQNIKKIDDIYVVNYDIPAILHKNNHNTDIAVMIFRSGLEFEDFKHMIGDMGESLVKNGILGPNLPFSRIFHYSKSPFEHLLDCSGYLLKTPTTHFSLGHLPFVRYLQNKGVPLKMIEGALKYPVMTYRNSSGGLVERDIFQYTVGSSFKTSYQKFSSALGQCYIS
ncbi:MAG: hypothetical protein JEY99_06335 [Spirochaetales bacterium]|nr:hypothetical protein [Spirochaetales bacterium]